MMRTRHIHQKDKKANLFSPAPRTSNAQRVADRINIRRINRTSQANKRPINMRLLKINLPRIAIPMPIHKISRSEDITLAQRRQ
jgi:hypothetical protein